MDLRVEPSVCGAFDVCTQLGTPVQLAVGDWVCSRPNKFTKKHGIPSGSYIWSVCPDSSVVHNTAEKK